MDDIDGQAVEADLAEMHDVPERLQIVETDRQAIEARQRRVFGIAHVELIDLEIAAHADLRAAERADEMHLQARR